MSVLLFNVYFSVQLCPMLTYWSIVIEMWWDITLMNTTEY